MRLAQILILKDTFENSLLVLLIFEEPGHSEFIDIYIFQYCTLHSAKTP